MYSHVLSEDTWICFFKSHVWFRNMSVFLYVYIDLATGRSLVKDILPNSFLIPWSRVFRENLTGFQLVKKFSSFYGTWRFINAFTNTHYLSLSWAILIQSIILHATSWKAIFILFSHLRLGHSTGLFPSGFPTKSLYTTLTSPISATCPAHIKFLDLITPTILGEEYRSLLFPPLPCYLIHLRFEYSP